MNSIYYPSTLDRSPLSPSAASAALGEPAGEVPSGASFEAFLLPPAADLAETAGGFSLTEPSAAFTADPEWFSSAEPESLFLREEAASEPTWFDPAAPDPFSADREIDDRLTETQQEPFSAAFDPLSPAGEPSLSPEGEAAASAAAASFSAAEPEHPHRGASSVHAAQAAQSKHSTQSASVFSVKRGASASAARGGLKPGAQKLFQPAGNASGGLSGAKSGNLAADRSVSPHPFAAAQTALAAKGLSGRQLQSRQSLPGRQSVSKKGRGLPPSAEVSSASGKGRGASPVKKAAAAPRRQAADGRPIGGAPAGDGNAAAPTPFSPDPPANDGIGSWATLWVKSDAALQGASPKEVQAAFSRFLRDRGADAIVREAKLIVSNGESGHIKLLLTPQKLGRVKIDLNISDNHLVGKIWVENSSIRDAFKDSMEQLAQTFGREGFQGVDLNLSTFSESGQGRAMAEEWEKQQLRLAAAVGTGPKAPSSEDGGWQPDSLIHLML